MSYLLILSNAYKLHLRLNLCLISSEFQGKRIIIADPILIGFFFIKITTFVIWIYYFLICRIREIRTWIVILFIPSKARILYILEWKPFQIQKGIAACILEIIELLKHFWWFNSTYYCNSIAYLLKLKAENHSRYSDRAYQKIIRWNEFLTMGESKHEILM